MIRTAGLVIFGCAVLLVGSKSNAAGDTSGTAIQHFLDVNFGGQKFGMVVALVDAHGVETFCSGAMGDSANTPVSPKTIFEIGSCSKTFTALVLQEEARAGNVKLDDPVQSLLPEGVHVPTFQGKSICLVNLAAQDSGFPFNADNLAGSSAAEKYRTFSVARTYEFLAHFQLSQTPGEKYQYSNFGMGLLGHALSLKRGKSYEAMVVERVCDPLGMQDTRVQLSPEQLSRFASGFDETGKPTEHFELPDMAGAGALRSTASDLAKYVAANLGLTSCPMQASMQAMQVWRHKNKAIGAGGQTAMPWYDQSALNPEGSRLMGHGGGTGGFNSFIGFDTQQRRGVAALTNQTIIHSLSLGWRILQRARLEGVDAAKMMPVFRIGGVGIVLGLDANKAVIARELLPGPAKRAGVQPGDVICSVDGQTTGVESLDAAAELLRGEPGTTVVLELMSESSGATPGAASARRKLHVVREAVVVGA